MNDLIMQEIMKEFKKILEKIMIKERDRYLKEHPETRGNGYYPRTPKTILGEIELSIPRTRDNNFKTAIFPERKRVAFYLDDIARAIFLAGVSSRKTGEIIKNLIGTNISASFLSSSIKDIAIEEIENFKNRKLKEYYPVLYIDATYVPLKRDTVDKEAVYAVIGLREDGRREILSYSLPGGKEKAEVWQEILEDLRDRGLKTPKMIISDDLTGIREKIKEVFPSIEHQLCWFHLKKNLKNKVRKKHYEEIWEELEEIIGSENVEEGRKKFKVFLKKWGKLYRSVKILEEKVENYLYFLKYPKKIRSYLRTTNYAERCFKELKDKIRIRGYLKNEESSERFLYVFFKDKHEKYLKRKLKYSEIIEEVFANEN